MASDGAGSPATKLDPVEHAHQISPAEELGGLDYETAREALVDVVARLEAGNLALEESLALWERGESLARVCRARLDGARARLDAALGVAECPG